MGVPDSSTDEGVGCIDGVVEFVVDVLIEVVVVDDEGGAVIDVADVLIEVVVIDDEGGAVVDVVDVAVEVVVVPPPLPGTPELPAPLSLPPLPPPVPDPGVFELPLPLSFPPLPWEVRWPGPCPLPFPCGPPGSVPEVANGIGDGERAMAAPERGEMAVGTHVAVAADAGVVDAATEGCTWTIAPTATTAVVVSVAIRDQTVRAWALLHQRSVRRPPR